MTVVASGRYSSGPRPLRLDRSGNLFILSGHLCWRGANTQPAVALSPDDRPHPCAVLTSFTDVAASCGLDARAPLVDAGLPQRCLDEPDLKVPARAIAHLLELAAQRGKEPASGCAWRNRGAC